MGVKIGVVDKSGAWYSFNGEKIGQGKETARTYLKEHPDVAEKIEKKIRNNSDLVSEVTEKITDDATVLNN